MQQAGEITPQHRMGLRMSILFHSRRPWEGTGLGMRWVFVVPTLDACAISIVL